MSATFLKHKITNKLKGGKKVAGVIKELFQPVLDLAAEERIKKLMQSLQGEYEKTVKDRKKRDSCFKKNIKANFK